MSNVPFIHIGGMRTGSTLLQRMFKEHSNIDLRLKTRFFSFDVFFEQGTKFFNGKETDSSKILIDSDENYSIGRFKSELIRYTDPNFNVKKELSFISHDVDKMSSRIAQHYPEAKIIMVIRSQANWIKSVYKHDIQHFGIDCSFEQFLASELGKAYCKAADYNNLYQTYAQKFGPKNVYVFFFEELIKSPTVFFEKLSNILGTKISLLENKQINSGRSDIYIRILRTINKISQSNKNIPERRAYYMLKNLLSKCDNLTRLIPHQSLVNDSEISSFRFNYIESNMKLANQIKCYDMMKEFNYPL